jgi:coenzyme F420-reducing hydrogenase beta subunit
MPVIFDKQNCTGCRACEQKCIHKAIQMKANEEGFLYPEIDSNLCNNCGLCEKICPIFRDDLQRDVLEVFAAKSLNREQMLRSASGGIFPLLAENILEKNGIVFGCAYDEDLVAIHIAVENSSELHRLQSSKYVQSDTLNTYTQAKDFLEQNRKVLYSGTPCQIAGLKAFCGKDYENLATVDLVCHGVPSPGLFAKYIGWLGKKMGGRIIYYDFRSKERGGWGYDFKTKTKTKTKYLKWHLDPYFRSFLRNETLRECCYSCKYACGKRVGDITIADYWGIKQMHPDFFSSDGVSAVLVNTHKGKSLFENIKNKVEYIQSSFESVAKIQVMLNRPAKRPIARDYVYNNINESFFKIPLLMRLKSFIPVKIKRMMRKFKNRGESK